MTHAPTHRAMRPRAVLSRRLVALAFAVFGVPQSHADGTVTHASPAAQRQVEQAHGILTVQRQLLRAQLPGDNSPDVVEPGAAVQAQQPLFAATMSPAPQLSLLPVAI